MGRKGGKRFRTIYIRQIANAKSSTNPKNKPSAPLMNRPLNILLAEDERSVAFSISFALKADAHKIEIVSDGEKALSELAAKPGAFDLLITDHSMPRMNGIELVKRLRDTAFRGKIVVLSAHLSAENRSAYLALGVDLMIPKPFDVHQLRASIMQTGMGEVATVQPETSALCAPEVYRLLRLGIARDGSNFDARHIPRPGRG
jgi:CheY-like chemotaxis protein